MYREAAAEDTGQVEERITHLKHNRRQRLRVVNGSTKRAF